MLADDRSTYTGYCMSVEWASFGLGLSSVVSKPLADGIQRESITQKELIEIGSGEPSSF